MSKAKPEWSEGVSLEALWQELGTRASVRQRRLHACGCFRFEQKEALIPEDVVWIDLAERFADGLITEEELIPAHTTPPQSGDASLALLSNPELNRSWDRCIVNVPEDDDFEIDHAAPRIVARLRILEDIVGPPEPQFSLKWRTSTATALAQQMYESRDFGAMPILADALQDAGCTSDAILNHCRDPHATHVRGCWVVDLVLGKS